MMHNATYGFLSYHSHTSIIRKLLTQFLIEAISWDPLHPSASIRSFSSSTISNDYLRQLNCAPRHWHVGVKRTTNKTGDKHLWFLRLFALLSFGFRCVSVTKGRILFAPLLCNISLPPTRSRLVDLLHRIFLSSLYVNLSSKTKITF